MTDADASTEARRAGRYDIYGPIHKGLRLLWSDLMKRLGSADFENPAVSAAVLAELRRGLDLGAKHLGHEEKFMHPELNARKKAPVSASIDTQHQHHRARFDELHRLIADVEAAASEARPLLGRRLYLAFSTFVAEDLEHMAEEETVTWLEFCDVFTDHELETTETTILASVAPEDIMDFLRVMLPAMNRRERAALLGSIRAAAPPEAFAGAIEHAARPTLSADDFADLADRLKLTG